MYLSASRSLFKKYSEVSKTEKNDCVVRSIASAAEVSYKIAHKFCEKFLVVKRKKELAD